MREYLVTIITATAAAWLLQQSAPPPAQALPAGRPAGAATR
ncbi:hypothetical protein ACM61V_13900 [Sphingomonas sp. TX0543]|nr:hypothetical protein [Sphingomonas sp. 3P27F8]